MTSNQHREMFLNSEQVRACLHPLIDKLDSFDVQTARMARFLEEARLGDAHNYLSSGIAAGFDSCRISRRAASELRDVIDRVIQTLRVFKQHDQAAHTGATSIAAPLTSSQRTTLEPTPIDRSFTAITAREAAAQAASEADTVIAHTEAALAELDQPPAQTIAIPNESATTIREFSDVDIPPTILASVKASVEQVEPPALSVDAHGGATNATPLAEPTPTPPVPNVTPPPTPSIMPAADVEITEDNRSWWDQLVSGFYWIGDQLSKLFKSLINFAVNLAVGALLLAVVTAVIYAIGVLLVTLGIIGSVSLTVVFLIALLIITVISVISEFNVRIDEYRSYKGEPDQGVYFPTGIISLLSLFGIPQIIEGWQGRRLLTERGLTEQEKWDAMIQGAAQLFLALIGIRLGLRGLIERTKPATVPTQPKPTTVPTQPKPATAPAQPEPATVPAQPEPATAPAQPKPATSSTRTMPSGRGKLDGKPAEIDSVKMDAETIRSLTRENESAKLLAQNGYDVYQNPPLEKLKSNNNKKPDLLVEGTVFDVYSPSSSNPRNIASSIENKIRSGQTDRIILNLDDSSVSIEALQEQFKTYPIEGLQEIIIIKDGKVILFFPFEF